MGSVSAIHSWAVSTFQVKVDLIRLFIRSCFLGNFPLSLCKTEGRLNLINSSILERLSNLKSSLTTVGFTSLGTSLPSSPKEGATTMRLVAIKIEWTIDDNILNSCRWESHIHQQMLMPANGMVTPDSYKVKILSCVVACEAISALLYCDNTWFMLSKKLI